MSKIALITGATSGIGEGHCLLNEFGKTRYNLIITGRKGQEG